MYAGKYTRKYARPRRNNGLIVAILCLCLAAGAIGGVVAYLTSITDPLANEFVPVKVSCDVEETFVGGVKSDVKVRNTGDVDAYIRACVIVNFVTEDGMILANAPQENADYTILWGASGWEKGADGYWYHRSPVAPEEVTAPLIDQAVSATAQGDYKLQIQIIASAVQSNPDQAVQDAWGITPVNGELIP